MAGGKLAETNRTIMCRYCLGFQNVYMVIALWAVGLLSSLPGGRRVRYLLAKNMVVREAQADEVLAVLKDQKSTKRASVVSAPGFGLDQLEYMAPPHSESEPEHMDDTVEPLIGQEERETGVCT